MVLIKSTFLIWSSDYFIWIFLVPRGLAELLEWSSLQFFVCKWRWGTQLRLLGASLFFISFFFFYLMVYIVWHTNRLDFFYFYFCILLSWSNYRCSNKSSKKEALAFLEFVYHTRRLHFILPVYTSTLLYWQVSFVIVYNIIYTNIYIYKFKNYVL